MGWALVAVFGLGLGVVQVRRAVAVERAIHARRPLYILDAARVLARPASESRPRLLARKGHIAYYAGFDFVPYSTSVNSLEDLVRYARSCQAEYIVYSTLEYSLLPRMLFLAVADAVPLLQEVYRAPSIRIFRLGDDTRTTLSAAERFGLLLANLRAARLQRRPAAVYLACEDLGRHHMQRQAFAEAEQAFQRALEAALQAGGGDPELERYAVAARFNLAGAQLKLGRPEAAVRILQENLAQAAAQESPLDLARNHARLGLAYEMLGRHEEALRERRLARAMDPQGGLAADPESLEVHRPAP
jgi:tetratricopeptide (TPR) repeat protein